jgi:hypothetical protein
MTVLGVEVIYEADPTVVAKAQGQLVRRMDPGFWAPQWEKTYQVIRRHEGWVTFGTLIQEMTNGNREREYARGRDPKVRFVQVANVRRTGIDVFASAPGKEFVKLGGTSDPERSRLQSGDVLLLSGAVGSLGRCVVVREVTEPTNVSQDVNIIRVQGINPYYFAIYTLSKYGQAQLERHSKGVSGMIKVGFEAIESIEIPLMAESLQSSVAEEYLLVSHYHDQAMEAKDKMLKAHEHGNKTAEQRYRTEYERNIAIAEAMLSDLIHQVEEIIEGTRTEIESVDRVLNEEQASGA